MNTSTLCLFVLLGLAAISQATPQSMARSVRAPNRLRAMKRGNYWTLNSLGYHGGLGKLFKTKRNGEMELNQAAAQPSFPKMMVRSLDEPEYVDDYEQSELLAAAERELLRRGY